MRKLTLLLVMGAFAAAPPSLAINDPLIPADECAPDHAPAGGHPHPESTPPNRGIATADPVNPPVSRNNPGATNPGGGTGPQGAQGQAMADPRC
jgi:hypothetical protein